MMGGLTARIAHGAVGICLAILCSGCAWWERSAIVNSAISSASSDALALTAAVEVAPSRVPLDRPLCSGVRGAAAVDLTSVTVHSGDTLGTIAFRAYGDRMRAMEIARLNDIENPDLIFPGQVLNLAQVERRCRGMHYKEATYVVDAAVGRAQLRLLNRRLFSPPSDDQPDQRRVRATASDPPLR